MIKISACRLILEWHVIAGAALLCPGVGAADSAHAKNGKALLERHCGTCHALSEAAASPLKDAPNLWTTLRSYPDEQLEFELSEGIGSRHSSMPQIQFSTEEIASIQYYLFSPTKRAP